MLSPNQLPPNAAKLSRKTDPLLVDLATPKGSEGAAKFKKEIRRFTHQANAPLVRCYAPWGSLFARKFSLLWRLGNSVRNQLNFLPKAGAPQLSRSQMCQKQAFDQACLVIT